MIQLAAVLFATGAAFIVWWAVDYVRAGRTNR